MNSAARVLMGGDAAYLVGVHHRQGVSEQVDAGDRSNVGVIALCAILAWGAAKCQGAVPIARVRRGHDRQWVVSQGLW
ncbi:MAG: hypothetical protein EBQ82_12570 [Betaproteobacteria bacterium]|nr:hypothetical protein [Betaproteobacteria bacterium]NBY06192.1 hypothetical protein [Betaproteobacteria bacterium]